MKRLLCAVLMAGLVAGLGSSGRAADDKDVQAVLDKAVKALGGADKLGATKVVMTKGKGKLNFAGTDIEFTAGSTVQGLDHFRGEFEGDFGGMKIMGVTVIAGDKGWRKIGDMKDELDKAALANEKRQVYLQLIPTTILPLKGKGFKVESAGTEKVGDKPAVVLKITGPDGKDFKLSFDQESGLPVKLVAKVADFMGNEFTQETTYANYKDMGGIKKATKVDSKRDGERFIEQEVTEFKVLDKVDPKAFTEPQ
jgi:hypothetical protein